MRMIFCFGLAICLLASVLPSALAWELERPSDLIPINRRTEDSKTDGKASVGLGVDIVGYRENWGGYPSDGDDDIVDLRIIATANTRKIISYGIYDNYYEWHSDLPSSTPLGDEQVIGIQLPYTIRFYGGPRSAEYDYIYVSSNGWIKFCDPKAAVPSASNPVNNYIAPFWRDLKPNLDGVIKYGSVGHWPGWGPTITCFAVTWENVPDANGYPQTFQVLMEQSRGGQFKHLQSRIWFQYKSITTGEPTIVEITDQQGARKTSYDYHFVSNEMTLLFDQTSNSAFVGSLKITLSEGETTAWTKIDEDKPSRRGYNVILETALPDDNTRFAFALSGGAVLLVEAFDLASERVPGAGFIFGAVLYAAEWAHDMARQQAEAKLFSTDDYTFAQAQAVDDPQYLFVSEAVDASFGIVVYWVLNGTNNEDHNLQITCELNYVEYDSFRNVVSSPIITTSVNLKLNGDANNSYERAKVVSPGTYSGFFLGGTDTEDYFKIYANAGQIITAIMFPPSNADFNMYLHSPDEDGRHQRDHSELPWNATEYIYYTANCTGFWYIKMKPSGGYKGFYTFLVNVLDPPPPEPPGGCPYVSTWNGSNYVLDNNLIPAAEHSNGADVTDHYMLQKPPVQNSGKYPILIWDLDKHSFLDHVELMAIDHETDVNIAVSPDGQILTYKNPTPPTTAFNKDGTGILNLIDAQDSQYYEGHPGDYVQLDFGNVNVQDGAKLVVRTDPSEICDPFCKQSIHIQTLNATGQWVDVASFIPRLYWSIDIFDLSNHLPDINGDLQVRLYFTGHHKIDYAGLDTSKQGEYELHYANLAVANHTRLGDVKELLRNSDNQYVELLPGEQVGLQFTLPPNTEEKRDFLIILEGHYFLMS